MFRTYVCIRQHDVTDCGAACLATVARAHRLRIPIATIRQLAGTDCKGTSVLGLVEAAQRLGFEAKGVRGNLEALEKIPLPGIAHVISRSGTLHFVVIHKVTAGYLIIADPARGIIKVGRSEFAAAWSGILVLLMPGSGFAEAGQSTGTWARLGRVLKPHRFLLGETLAATLAYVLLGLGTSVYVQLLVDRVLVGKDWTGLRRLSLGLILILVCRALLGVARGILSAHVGRKIDLSLMLEYYRHVLRLPMQFFDSRRTGEIISRLNDAVKIREAIGGATLTLLVDSVLMLGGFGILAFYSLTLALQGIVALPLLAWTVVAMSRPMRRAQRAALRCAETLQSSLVECVGGIAAIKAFGAECAAGERTEQATVRLLRSSFLSAAWGVSCYVTGEMLTAVAAVGLLWTAGSMVIKGEITIGEMLASYSVLSYVLQPMLRLIGVNQAVQDAFVATDRLAEILDLDLEFKAEANKLPLPSVTSGAIAFKQVSFRYGMRERVLEDVTLQIQPRSMVVLLGRSGGGKTTMARLLLRFYEASGGQVEIDGSDVRDIRLDELRDRVGFVDQDAAVFSGTIEDNLTLGDRRVRLDAVIAAVRAVGLEPYISGLPDRYGTMVGERGLTLSGGQRQLLAIARAIARDTPILILDEATSNLDPQTELTVLESLCRLRARKTILIIAHRIRIAAQADQIVVLDAGRIVEQGNHCQLLAVDGLYRAFWNSYLEGIESRHVLIRAPTGRVE